MAEQEACTALVDDATRDEELKTPTTPTASGQLEGECQLLPLLQGLLDAPENDITPDSGTESGEDQRTNLIVEVQSALEKLSNSLKNDQTDITPERRSSLLQLVTKLQAGLSGSSAQERRASTVSNVGRFQKRRSKQARHTVGVSKEELADARKLIEQISVNELTPSVSTNKLQLSKQNSESSVATSSASSSYRNVHNKIKNVTAKPFSSSNSTTSSIQTPTEHFDGFDVLFNDTEKETTENNMVFSQQKTSPAYVTIVKPNLDRNTSVDSNASIKSAYKAVQEAAATKVKREQSREEHKSETEEEDESSTVKGASDLENAPLLNNPIYSKPPEHRNIHEDRSSRFDTQKKLKMKRANTIDIPKPLHFYEDEDDSGTEQDDDDQKKRDNYYALKGPINVGNPHTKKIVPTFEPKTDSDKKFLAFINKHNENSGNKGSIWAQNTSVWSSRFGNIKNTFERTPTQDAKTFWKSTDDGITKSSSNQFGPKISRRSARNLQQMFEEKQKEIQGNVQRPGDVHRHDHVKATSTQNSDVSPAYQQHNVVTGSLQVKPVPEKQYRVIPQPLPVNQFSHAPQSAFKPIKRASQSPSKRISLVFSPEGNEILKSEIKDNSGSSFLYSPKPISSSVENSAVTSPITSKPWAASTGGSRVLSLAASKFEQPLPQPEPPKPRKLSKDLASKVFIPANQINDRPASYLPKSGDNKSSTVRKLSGQYENNDNKVWTAKQQPRVQTYELKTSIVESQYTQPMKHYEPNVKPPVQSTPLHSQQNYRIRNDQPQNYTIKYDQQQQNYIQPNNRQINQSRNYGVPSNQHDNKNQINLPQHYNIQYDQPRLQIPQSNEAQTQHYQPQNYSVRYEQQQIPASNYSIRCNYLKPDAHQTDQVKLPYDHHRGISTDQHQYVPRDESKQTKMVAQTTPNYDRFIEGQKEFTSSCEFKPNQVKVPIQAIEPQVQPPKVQRQISDESVHEYNAVNSRVMSGPVSQQAVTIRQKSPMSRDQHDMQAAFSLKNSLQKVGNKQDMGKQSVSPVKSPTIVSSNSFSCKPKPNENKSPTLSQSFNYKSELGNSEQLRYKPSDCPKPTISPSSFKFRSTFDEAHRESKNCGVVKPMQQQKTTTVYNNTTANSKRKVKETDEKNLSVVTGQFHIPVINVKSPESPRLPSQAQVLSKSDSWHEICMAHQITNQKPTPKSGPMKSKSSHQLAVPKLFEAGMSKEEMVNKRRTMEAFLTGNKSPEMGDKSIKRSINRIKTSHKISTQSRSSGGGLSRSRTLPDMVCPNLLDESNVDKSFDELFQSS